MSYPKHPAYKDSGVEWLGQAPSEWVLTKLKRVGMLKGGAGFPHELQGQVDGALPFYKVGDLARSEDDRHLGSSQHWISWGEAEQLRATVIPSDSIVWAKIGAALMLNRRRLTVQPSCIDNNMSALIPYDSVHPEWVYYWMSNVDFGDYVNPGAVPSLSEGDQGEIAFLLPSRAEQSSIISFLNNATSLLDELIAEQRHLIDLLQEKRQAVISQAVTKGLDPNVPMKDSGVEWLGEVPEHWSVGPLKYMCTFQGGGTPSKENPDFWSGDIPWVSAKDMKSYWISDSQDKITATAVSQSSTNVIDPGALLIVVRSGILQRTIPVGINTVPTAINQDIKALTFHEPGVAEYIAYLIRGMEGPLLHLWRKQGATVESLEHEFLANTPLPLPPGPEIDSVLQVLRNIDLGHDSLEHEAQRAIELLRERRSALISAAVTGKIDVRNWQPPATDSPSEPVEELVHG